MQHTPIADVWHRVWRTVVQAALAFLTFAPVYPLVVEAVGAPADSTLGVWLAVVGVWVATVAGVITRLMAIPALNRAAAKVRLDGHSGTAVAVEESEGGGQTWTSIIRVQDGGGEFTGDPAT